MQTAKSWFSLVMALLPVLFFGGFFLYFSGVNNAFYGMLDGALGPTRMGLGALTILFALLFLWKLRRFSTPAPVAPKGATLEASLEETKSDFDADAAMARYLARRGPGADGAAPSRSFGGNGPPPGFGGDQPPRPPAGSFGRKGTLG